MQKYMTHPKYGGKLVYLDDFEKMEKDGWVFSEEIKKNHYIPIPDGFENDLKITLTPAQQYEEKYGKKPHHRLKPESIIAALED